jgi:hypothetical protein
MSHRTAFAMALAFGGTLAVSAQSPQPATPTTPTAKEVTVTGCVERADQMSAAGTAGTTVDSLSFLLTHAATGTADSHPAGTTGTSAKSLSGTMYRLDADMSKLNPHVGHKVEITGTLAAAAPMSKTTDDTDPAAAAANAPKLKVERVKMVSETCAR